LTAFECPLMINDRLDIDEFSIWKCSFQSIMMRYSRYVHFDADFRCFFFYVAFNDCKRVLFIGYRDDEIHLGDTCCNLLIECRQEKIGFFRSSIDEKRHITLMWVCIK